MSVIKPFTNSTILVIGGAGFVGSHVVDELLKEDVGKIKVFDNFSRGTRENLKNASEDPRVEILDNSSDICQVDILDDAMKNVDYVIHLAAAWLLQCYEYPRTAFNINITGTYNVLEACVNNNIKKLIFVSSSSVYGEALKLPMVEDHPYNNRTFYGATKIAAEHMCRAFNERHGLDYLALRYMNVYGPRQDYKGVYISVIMKILDRIKNGKSPIVYGNGSQAYDFNYVEDVARATVYALKSRASDEFINISSGKQTSIEDLAKKLLKLTNSDLEIEYQPEKRSFVTNRIGSTKKAKKLIGYETTVFLDEGLKKLIDWRENK